MVVVLTDRGAADVAGAVAEGDALWLPLDALPVATGWEWKAEGICRDDVCIPIPPGREATFVQEGRLNTAAFWRYLDAPTLHDEGATVWLLGESAASRARQLQSLEPPDFELPDLDGRMHRLSDYRGRKILLVTWASW